MANSRHSRLFSKGPVNHFTWVGESRLISFRLVDRLTTSCRKALRQGKIQTPVRFRGPREDRQLLCKAFWRPYSVPNAVELQASGTCVLGDELCLPRRHVPGIGGVGEAACVVPCGSRQGRARTGAKL
jgi:hypothetical protein